MNPTIQFTLLCLYLMLPAAIANMTPVFVRNVDFLNVPVDFNKTWKGQPIFGSHKTYRGFFWGILIAILAAFLQKLLYQFSFFRQISFFNFETTSFLLIGFALGFGALFGDLVKSFFKRRMNIKPGDSFFPWDQLDLVLGSIVFISIIKIPTWQMILFGLIVGPLLHISFNHLGYWLGIKEEKW